jgi:glutathione S-transferase
MADQEIKLIGVWGSPFSRRVEIALKMKGIVYEFLDEDLKNKSPLLLKYNPVHKKVPVFVHNGKPIAESLVIVEYIDETFKSGLPILPQDPYARAMARFWAKFIDDKCMPSIWKIRSSQGDEQKKAVEEALENLKTLENELKGNKFFGGDEIGFVDIAANFLGLWLGIVQEMMGVDLLTKEKLPKLSEWVDNYLNNDIIKKSLPPRDELAVRLRALFGGK